jgi:hypothetical protein
MSNGLSGHSVKKARGSMDVRTTGYSFQRPSVFTDP